MECRWIAIAATLVACAGARVVIERPIAQQCESTGLKGCPDLTEGVLLYIEGDQQNGIHKLHLAVNENEPDEVLSFANSLKTIAQIPGAGQFAAPIMQVVDILASEAKQVANRPPPPRRGTSAVATKTSRDRSQGAESTLTSGRDDAPTMVRRLPDQPPKSSPPNVAVAAVSTSWATGSGRLRR
jgi:hypothetical protein